MRFAVVRRRDVVGGAALTCLLAVSGGSILPAASLHSAAAGPAHHRRHHVVIADPAPADRPNAAAAALAPPAPPLPPAVTAPLPAPPAVTAAVLRPHEVFGFAPYWTLGASGGYDVGDLTTIAYFGVDAAADGSLVQSGPGWNGYQSQALADLISRAHGSGDRVVLTVECFDQAALDRLTADPGADARLADAVIAAVRAKSLDGLNLDFEGTGAGDRAGLVRLVGYLSARLRAADPHWQFTVDTYAGSATDPNGFFDVQHLAPAVDALFVMAYDMYRSGTASPNAPLSGGSPSDQAAVQGYVAAVPAGKVILGVPFYGYEWQTASNAPRAAAVSGPTPVSYAQVAAAGATTTYWDPQGAVPWTAFQDPSGQWHEVYYDDPQSVGLKAQLADSAHLLGVGIWALGMDGNAPAMMAALLGHSPVVKSYPNGPASPSPSPAPTTTSSSTTSTSTSTSTTSTTRPPQAVPNPTRGGSGGGGSGGGSGGGGGGGGGAPSPVSVPPVTVPGVR
jgi:chitinase